MRRSFETLLVTGRNYLLKRKARFKHVVWFLKKGNYTTYNITSLQWLVYVKSIQKIWPTQPSFTALFKCQTHACCSNMSCFLFQQIHKSSQQCPILYHIISVHFSRNCCVLDVSFWITKTLHTQTHLSTYYSTTQYKFENVCIKVNVAVHGWQMVIRALPDVKISQLQLLKCMKNSPSTCSSGRGKW